MGKDLGKKCQNTSFNIPKLVRRQLSADGWKILDEAPTVKGYVVLSHPTGQTPPTEDTRNRLSLMLNAQVYFEGEDLSPEMQKYRELLKDLGYFSE
jgi:hypothetical protein